MIGSPITFTTSGQCYHHFCPQSSTNNDTATPQPFIEALRILHRIISECCEIFEHKATARIIHGPNFLPEGLIRRINQFNNLHGDKANDSPI